LDRRIRAWRAGGFDALIPAERQVDPRTDAEVLDLVATRGVDLRPCAIFVQPVSGDADDRLHALRVIQCVSDGQVGTE
jgi:hypothetical protein